MSAIKIFKLHVIQITICILSEGLLVQEPAQYFAYPAHYSVTPMWNSHLILAAYHLDDLGQRYDNLGSRHLNDYLYNAHDLNQFPSYITYLIWCTVFRSNQ